MCGMMTVMSPPGPLDPLRAFQTVFELFDASIEIMRLNLRRRHPEASEAEVEAMLRRWLMKADQPLSQSFSARGR